MIAFLIYLPQNSIMYNFLFAAHNIVRYLLLVALVLSFVNAFVKDFGKKPLVAADNIINRIALSLMHVQFLVGIVLYTQSPKVSFEAGFMKNPVYRYYTMEHITMMLVAVILVTIGIARVKRLPEIKKHRSVWSFELIALVLISAALLTLK